MHTIKSGGTIIPASRGFHHGVSRHTRSIRVMRESIDHYISSRVIPMNTNMHNDENSKYDCLKLSSQLCFPLYAVSKEIIRRYKPFLDELDLTYTQYIAMMAMWEHRELNVKELGELLFLDSGTLTPVLKKLEHKGYVTRNRSRRDERNLIVTITDEGLALRDKALDLPNKMGACMGLDSTEFQMLYTAVLHLLANVSNNK